MGYAPIDVRGQSPARLSGAKSANGHRHRPPARAGVSALLFQSLSDAGINIEMISTSEIRISVVTRADTINDAVRVVHAAFGLDADEVAQVHGGTGR